MRKNEVKNLIRIANELEDAQICSNLKSEIKRFSIILHDTQLRKKNINKKRNRKLF